MLQKCDRLFFGSLKKREPTKKHLSLGTDVDEPKTSSFVNPRM